MKTIRVLLLSAVALALFATKLTAQDLSKYRSFTLGTNLTTILKQTSQSATDVKMVHQQPALIQELTWWPGSSHRAEAVQEIVFSFQNGNLYKMSIIYDRAAVEGFTAGDMIQSLATKYGRPTQLVNVAADADADKFDFKPKAIAIWEDSDHSINLVRTAYTAGFGLEVLSKENNAQAEASIVEAVKLEEQQLPQKEAARLKQQDADRETARQKNIKSFQP